MPNFLRNFGLETFEESEDTMRGLIGHVIQEGKGITGYYGIPYLNKHLGDVQMIARLEKNDEGKYAFRGLDTHCAGRSVWEVRIVDELNALDDDPLSKRLLVKGLDGGSPFIASIVNADVLPSFSEDEVLKLQMIAYTEKINFYENDDAFMDTVQPGPNGVKFSVGDDSFFPLGLFSKDDDPATKDLVQIHGTVEKAFWGRVDLGQEDDEKLQTFIICRVKTQFGNIEIVESADSIDEENSKHIHPGAIADCLAYLCGDPAIYELDQGIVKNQENNLKLVAYTLSKGDPERLRTVLSDSFKYHSDVGDKNIEGADAYIEFVNYIHHEGMACHAFYTTITEHKEGETPEYPIGTRCLVLKYEGEEEYSSLVFVDTNEDGNIERILVSRDTRYRFKVDPGFPKVENILENKVDVREAIYARAGLYRLYPRYVDLAFVEKTLLTNEDTFKDELSDLLSKETFTEEDFGNAYLRGVELSSVNDYDADDIIELGKLLYKDAVHHIDGDNQTEEYQKSLLLVMAIGSLYAGRVDDQKESKNMEYLTIDGIRRAFGEHMMKYRGYSEEEAKVAVHDFPDPYSNPYLREEYIDDVEVDGIEYERNADCVDLTVCDIDDVPRFCFYTLYCIEDIPDHKVGEYRTARKLFQIDDLDPADFPSDGDN